VTSPTSIIHVGDCRDVLRTLPERSIQTVVTSPPYFGLRSYTNGDLKAQEIGTEPTPDEFVRALVGVFREVRRLRREPHVSGAEYERWRQALPRSGVRRERDGRA
jgi:DNA modification methylase